MRIALLQTQPVAEKAVALARLGLALQAAQAQGADLLLTPEMYLSGYHIGADVCRKQAERQEGDSLQALRALARRYAVALVVGFPERDGDKVYNSAALIDAHGSLLACYRKTHLFGEVDAAQFSAGEQLSAVVDWRGWRVALAICYDIEFPELARSYALAGADLILVPTANMHPYDSVCQRIIPVRAEENALYVAYANYIGREGGFHYCGQSCVCSPRGEDMARGGQEEALLLADLSQQALGQARQAMPYLQQRRAGLYRL